MQCLLATCLHDGFFFGFFFGPEDRGDMFYPNVGLLSKNCMA
jgi:hypothetical protein